MTRVLLIGGARALRTALASAFGEAGFSTRAAPDGVTGQRHLQDFRPDLVVLDPRLPDRNGLDLARAIREVGRAGVILIGSSDRIEDKVAGLNAADDYVTGGTDAREVVARGRAVVRRLRGEATATLSFADVEIDEARHEATRAGTPLGLTPKEFDLLRFFLLHPRRVLSKEEILEAVWGSVANAEGATVQTYVGYLRRKLARLGPPILHTVRTFGYVLREGRPPSGGP